MLAWGLGPCANKEQAEVLSAVFSWFVTAQVGSLALQGPEPFSRACGSKTTPREHRISESLG